METISVQWIKYWVKRVQVVVKHKSMDVKPFFFIPTLQNMSWNYFCVYLNTLILITYSKGSFNNLMLIISQCGIGGNNNHLEIIKLFIGIINKSSLILSLKSMARFSEITCLLWLVSLLIHTFFIVCKVTSSLIILIVITKFWCVASILTKQCS